jgi:predicted DNA binding CopG/RHH family protein
MKKSWHRMGHLVILNAHLEYLEINNLIKMYYMENKEFKRINLRVDLPLYNQIEKRASESYLKIATYTRQLIQQALKNNFIKN